MANLEYAKRLDEKKVHKCLKCGCDYFEINAYTRFPIDYQAPYGVEPEYTDEGEMKIYMLKCGNCGEKKELPMGYILPQNPYYQYHQRFIETLDKLKEKNNEDKE
jgi:transcription elongation factor Elf1